MWSQSTSDYCGQHRTQLLPSNTHCYPLQSSAHGFKLAMSKFTLCIPETKLSNVDSSTVQPCMEGLTICMVCDFNCTSNSPPPIFLLSFLYFLGNGWLIWQIGSSHSWHCCCFNSAATSFFSVSVCLSLSLSLPPFSLLPPSPSPSPSLSSPAIHSAKFLYIQCFSWDSEVFLPCWFFFVLETSCAVTVPVISVLLYI